MGRLQVAPAAVPGLAVQFEGGGKRVRAASTPDYPLDNTGESEWSAGLAATYRRGAGVYQLSFRHFQTELGVCMCLRVESADDFFAQLGRRRPLGAELYTSSFEIERPYQAVAHELALARARWSLPAVGSVTSTYALQFDHRREFDVVRQATTGPQFSFRQWTHDADVALERVPVHVTDHLHLSGAAGVVGMLQHHGYAGLPLVPGHEAVAGGVYALERLWGHAYEIEAGLRYDYLARTASIVRRDYLRLVRSGQLTEATCGAAEGDADLVTCASRFHTISASLGGLLRVSPEWTVKLDLSTPSRPPNPDEQYLNGSAPSLPVVGLGQPDASAETTYSVSATLAHAGPHVTGEISAFGSYISDYLNFAPAFDRTGSPGLVAGHLQQRRELRGEIGVACHLQLAAEEELHGGLHAAVDHGAEVVVGAGNAALGSGRLARDAGGRGRGQIGGPGTAVGPVDFEQVDCADVLGLLGALRQDRRNFLIEECFDRRSHSGPPRAR